MAIKLINILKETQSIKKIMQKEYLDEGEGIEGIFQQFQSVLPNIYLRPNNVIDMSRYSQDKLDKVFTDLGFEFRKSEEGKLHYFNPETSISVYLNSQNRKLTLVP